MPSGWFPTGWFPVGWFPVGWFPVGVPSGSTGLIDLYQLWPLIVRTKSLLASGLTDEGGPVESVLKRLTDALLSGEANTASMEIRGIPDLVDADKVPDDFLPLLAYAIAAEFSPSWPIARRRELVKSMVFLWKASGQHRAWHGLFSAHNHPNWSAWELWKHDLHETHDYSWYQDYTHRLKAARVDILSGDPPTAVSWDDQTRMEIERIIEHLRPIHILIRAPVQQEAISEVFPWACDDGCEVACETGGETDVDYPPQAAAVMEDEAPGVMDILVITDTCVGWCEAQCESAGCEGSGCEAGSCETACEGLCETQCEVQCEATCEGSCEISCESSCETDCETVYEP